MKMNVSNFLLTKTKVEYRTAKVCMVSNLQLLSEFFCFFQSIGGNIKFENGAATTTLEVN